MKVQQWSFWTALLSTVTATLFYQAFHPWELSRLDSRVGSWGILDGNVIADHLLNQEDTLRFVSKCYSESRPSNAETMEKIASNRKGR